MQVDLSFIQKNIEFTAKVNEVPARNIQWFRDGKPIELTEEQKILSLDWEKDTGLGSLDFAKLILL